MKFQNQTFKDQWFQKLSGDKKTQSCADHQILRAVSPALVLMSGQN